MKLFVIREAGGIDNLTLIERPVPRPGPHEVLIKVRAVAINPRDLFVLGAADYFKLPLIPLSDGVGEVVATGAAVTRVKTGDRVVGIFMQQWLNGGINLAATRSALGGMIDGTLAEYIVLNEAGVIHVPEFLSDVEAVSLPCSGVTAWNALVDTGQVAAGETVVIAGTGSVSLLAIRIAKAFKVRVVVVSNNDDNLERAQALGAAETINYDRVPEWHERVLELTDGVGCDHLLETIGAPTIEQSLKAVRIGGQIIAIGAASLLPAQVSCIPVVLNCLTIRGIYVGSRAMFEALHRFMTIHDIHPVVDRVFSFDEAREAYAYLAAGRYFGKVCIAL